MEPASHVRGPRRRVPHRPLWRRPAQRNRFGSALPTPHQRLSWYPDFNHPSPAASRPPGPNSPPVVKDSSFTVAQGAGPLVVPAPGVLEGASDPDSDTVAVWNYTAPAHAGGGFAVSLTGSFVYQPAAGYVGRDTFTFVAADGMGNLASGTVSIVVTGEEGCRHPRGRWRGGTGWASWLAVVDQPQAPDVPHPVSTALGPAAATSCPAITADMPNAAVGPARCAGTAAGSSCLVGCRPSFAGFWTAECGTGSVWTSPAGVCLPCEWLLPGS
jgi:hypothetical protein